MASRWDELTAEYAYLDAQDRKVCFITDRTGFSAEGVRRVLVHLNKPLSLPRQLSSVVPEE